LIQDSVTTWVISVPIAISALCAPQHDKRERGLKTDYS